MSSGYYHQYAHVPPPPPPPPPPSHQFSYAPAPASSFAPPAMDYNNAPPSPLVLSVSPPRSTAPSRSSSQVRHHRGRSDAGEYIVEGGRSHYLIPAGNIRRSHSQSERGPILVEDRHGRHRKYDEPRRRQYYYEDDEDRRSVYSGSSYDEGSRGHSRSRSRHHSRTPSWASGDSFDSHRDSRYGVTRYKPSAQEEALNEKLKAVQKQLEEVQVAAERTKLQQMEAEKQKQLQKELEKKVQEQMEIAKRKEEERARKEREAFEAEKARIAAAAKKLLEEQAAAAAAAKAAEEVEKAKVQAIIDAERAKYAAAQQGKKTYTRFSKGHLVKEALDERNIPYSEEADYFLVHRFVEKQEQQYLWQRTKEIRAYYKQIHEAAERAPTVPGPNGGYVKYVQIAGQPYPIAIPVTITHTPGGGQTTKVESHKLKWTDIFKR